MLQSSICRRTGRETSLKMGNVALSGTIRDQTRKTCLSHNMCWSYSYEYKFWSECNCQRECVYVMTDIRRVLKYRIGREKITYQKKNENEESLSMELWKHLVDFVLIYALELTFYNKLYCIRIFQRIGRIFYCFMDEDTQPIWHYIYLVCKNDLHL